MELTIDRVQRYLLGPLVGQWFERFAAARRSKQRFDTMAKLCRQFLGSSAKAMWEDNFRREFYPSIQEPQFMVSLNKAFELVAIIGPSLYWSNPSREVRSPDMPDQAAIAQLLGITNEEVLSQIQQAQQQQKDSQKIRNTLCEAVLDYMSRNHPGGPKIDVELFCQDALVTGRGCLWTETYVDKTSNETMVGSFFAPVDSLLIDPDARDPSLRDVQWISRTHVEPVWVVERRFGYPPGYLQGKGTHISAEYQSRFTASAGELQPYQDLIEWVEVWSTGGIGARVTGIDSNMGQALDQLTGDNCYLCMTKNLSHPLNLPPNLVMQGQPEEILEALRWRTSRFGSVFELHKDRRWPVEVFDPYPVIGSCWPRAVLGAGIGSLLAMNLLLVSHLSMSWDRRRDIIATYEHMAASVESAIKSEENPAVIRINAASGMPIGDVVAFVRRPEIQGDLLTWIQYLDNQFQMATGLDDIHYGISQKQARVTSDVNAKQSAANVRPEKMAGDVHRAMVGVSQKELWLTMMYCTGPQLSSLLGPYGAMAWEQTIRATPFEVLIKEAQVYVEATDMLRPNREKDIADLEKMAMVLFPILQNYAPQTGDTSQINALISKFTSAMRMRDPDGLYLGSWSPPQNPQADQMQAQMSQLQAAQMEADIAETQAKATARLIDAQYKQQGATPAAMQRLQWTELFNAQKLRMQDESHLQKLVFQQENQQTPNRSVNR